METIGGFTDMLLRATNRRHWIATIPVLFACPGLLWQFADAQCAAGDQPAAGQSPPAAARVASLLPTVVDQPIPVVTALAIDPTGQWLAVAGDDKAIRILEASNLKEIAVLRGHGDLIRTVAFRHDGKVLASGGNDGSLILWEQATGYRQLRRIDDLPAVCRVTFSPQRNEIAAVGFGTEIMMFGGAADLAEMRCDCNDLRVCAYDQQGQRLAVAGRSGHVHLFDPRTGAAIRDFNLHNGRIRDCVFTRNDTRLLTVGEDGAVVLLDLVRGEVVQRIDLLPCKLFTLAMIDETHVAVAGSDNRIRIVDLDSGTVVKHLDGHRGSVSTLAYTSGALFSGGFDATLRRWPVESSGGERLAEKETPVLPPSESSSR